MSNGMDLQWATSALETYGVHLLFLLVFLEYLKLPIIPSGIVLPATGILIAQQEGNFILAVAITFVAGVSGSLTAYTLGYLWGQPILRKICSKSEKINQVVETVQSYIQDQGSKRLVIIRLIPIARTVVSLIAGSIQIKLRAFLFYSAIGIFIWNLVYIYLGYLFGTFFF